MKRLGPLATLMLALACTGVVHTKSPDPWPGQDLDRASDVPAVFLPDELADATATPESSLDSTQDQSTADQPQPVTLSTFEELLQARDAAGLAAFFAAYDMPVCDDGRCLFLTRQAGAQQVIILGDFDWVNGVTAAPLDLLWAVFYAVIEVGSFDVLEYKLKVDGEWMLDRSNRYFRFGPFGPNSAIYRSNRSRLALVGPVHSPDLGNDRMLYVYLPSAYFTDPKARFPVLYMQDGFNVFTNPQAPFGHWGVDASLDKLIPAGLVEPLLVVGIDTPDRVSEYLYNDITLDMGNGPEKVVPRLDSYGEFLKNTVKPLVDATFRTRPEREATAIAGSSFGGISSLYLAWTHKEVFSRVACLSGSFWVGEKGIARWVREAEGDVGSRPSMRELIAANENQVKPSDLKIYLDCGDTEGGKTSYAADSWVTTDWTRNALIRQGWTNRPEWDTDQDIATAPEDLPPDTKPTKVPHLAWAASPPKGYAGWADYLGVGQNLLCLVGHGQEHNEAAWAKRFRAALIFLFPGPEVSKP